MRIAPDIITHPGVLDSEEMVDAAYAGLLGLMDAVPGKGGLASFINGGRKDFVSSHLQFAAHTDGIYAIGSERALWQGRFDVAVDPLPQRGCVYVAGTINAENGQPIKDSFTWLTVALCRKLPPGIFCQCRDVAAVYQVTGATLLNARKRELIVEVSYFAIASDGAIWAGVDTKKRGSHLDVFAAHRHGAMALSALADRRYLWLIKSSASLGRSVGDGAHETAGGGYWLGNDAAITFGIDMSHVKSLCYARSLPITRAGRLRPILHWVSAHKRRLSLGIDVDVRKHLRGMDKFEMGGLGFEITQPEKPPARPTKIVPQQVRVAAKIPELTA